MSWIEHLADQLRPPITDAEAARAAVHVRSATRFEWMFRDAAWRTEVRPV